MYSLLSLWDCIQSLLCSTESSQPPVIVQKEWNVFIWQSRYRSIHSPAGNCLKQQHGDTECSRHQIHEWFLVLFTANTWHNRYVKYYILTIRHFYFINALVYYYYYYYYYYFIYYYNFKRWNGAVANKLHSVRPVLGDWQSSYRRCSKNEVVLCRVRIGHTHFTHLYIPKKDSPPRCVLTVRHIFGGVHTSRSDKKYFWCMWFGGIFDSTLWNFYLLHSSLHCAFLILLNFSFDNQFIAFTFFWHPIVDLFFMLGCR